MSQTQQIRKHLEDNGSITPLQALRLYGCFRCAARINEIRNSGMQIETNLIKRNGKRYARYSLI